MPDYQCPTCGIVYAKYQKILERRSEQIIAENKKSKETVTRFAHSKIATFAIVLAVVTTVVIGNSVISKHKEAQALEKKRTQEMQLARQKELENNRIEHEKSARLAREKLERERAVGQQQKQMRKAAEDAECAENAECSFMKLSDPPYSQCRDAVERRARYDFKWTDEGLFTFKFHIFFWKDTRKRSIVAGGDRLKLQNGFGAWQNVIYLCEVDATTGRILDIGISPGKL